jgi:hypothetical protein
MLRREIATIGWLKQGHRIERSYDECDSDYPDGDEVVMSQMAENKGL